jgi:hypothetical protein
VASLGQMPGQVRLEVEPGGSDPTAMRIVRVYELTAGLTDSCLLATLPRSAGTESGSIKLDEVDPR